MIWDSNDVKCDKTFVHNYSVTSFTQTEREAGMNECGRSGHSRDLTKFQVNVRIFVAIETANSR